VYYIGRTSWYFSTSHLEACDCHSTDAVPISSQEESSAVIIRSARLKVPRVSLRHFWASTPVPGRERGTSSLCLENVHWAAPERITLDVARDAQLEASTSAASSVDARVKSATSA